VTEAFTRPFTAGERPAPWEYQFQDDDGNPIADLSVGYTAKVVLREQWGNPVEANASVSNGPQAKVTYTWGAGDLAAPGRYRIQMWVGNGTVRWASVLHEFTVERGAGPAPNI
jgi:hypothetical protein